MIRSRSLRSRILEWTRPRKSTRGKLRFELSISRISCAPPTLRGPCPTTKRRNRASSSTRPKTAGRAFSAGSEDETIGLTQALIAELFQTTPQNVTLHLKAIFAEGELSEGATCKESLQVRVTSSAAPHTSASQYQGSFLCAVLKATYHMESLSIHMQGTENHGRIYSTVESGRTMNVCRGGASVGVGGNLRSVGLHGGSAGARDWRAHGAGSQAIDHWKNNRKPGRGAGRS
jgi:hypothetical protein